ncbi:MAG: PAS domain S-box protein [Mariprofundaceae bacterium]
MQKIAQAIGKSFDPDKLLVNVVDCLRDIYGADRAWLLHPCDPAADAWTVPVESCNPDYPGLFVTGESVPLDDDSRSMIRQMLVADGPVVFRNLPSELDWVRRFSIRSQMVMVIRPVDGKPWLMGMHQCSHAHDWSEEEQALFSDIASRLGDVLGATCLRRELQKNEERLKLALDAANEGLWDFDLMTDEAYFSPQWLAMLGYESGQVESCMHSWEKLLHPDDRAKAMQVFQDHAHGLSEQYEDIFRLKARNGDWLWVLAKGKVVERDGADRAIRAVGTHANISDRMWAEQALRESEETFRAVTENALVGVYLIQDGSFKYVNPKLAHTLGYEPEEIIGCMHPKQLIAEESWPVVEEQIRKRMSGEQNEVHYEFKGRGKHGEFVEVEVFGSRTVYRGKPALIGTLLDMTDSKRTEKALKESRNMMRLVLDTIPARVFWKDRDSNYLGCNQRFAEDAGLDSQDDIIGKNDFDLAWREQAMLYRRDDHETIATGMPKLNYLESQTLPGGARARLRTSKIPLPDAEGNIIGVLGCYEDVTAQEALAGQLRRAQKAEALSTLVSGLAHDFNNGLSGMMGMLYMAMQEVQDRPVVMRRLSRIDKLCLDAADTIKQLMTFVRQGKSDMKTVSLNEFIEDAMGVIRMAIPENIVFRYTLCDQELRVCGDISQLQQVLLSLCSNAREALDGVNNGWIELNVEALVLDGMRAGQASAERSKGLMGSCCAHICLKDNGCGIKADDLERIFDPFYSSKHVGRGSGLGLAVVFGIVEMHGGCIDVESEPGAGSTFHIYLPLHIDAKGLPESTDGLVKHQETILLVDDEDYVREAVRELLSSMGYRVILATNGREAVARFEEEAERIDLVILDVVMPQLGGVPAAKQIRALKPQIPIIMASGYDHEFDDEVMKQRYRMKLLTKPYRPKSLGSTIRQMLDRAA